jgi:hypothetical protein
VRDSEHVRESRVDAVCQSNDRRLLVSQDRRDAACGDNGWDADKTAGAQNYVWAKRGQRAACSQHTEGYARGIGDISQ